MCPTCLPILGAIYKVRHDGPGSEGPKIGRAACDSIINGVVDQQTWAVDQSISPNIGDLLGSPWAPVRPNGVFDGTAGLWRLTNQISMIWSTNIWPTAVAAKRSPVAQVVDRIMLSTGEQLSIQWTPSTARANPSHKNEH